ncbi:MAG: ferredoxin [Rhodocyclaceae bacterium]|nr:ferredoxin [Rhodocyclaceae bacterium]
MPSFEIRISESGECFPCDSGQSVLEGMARLGRRGIPLGCRGGGCGVCKVEVVSGRFERKAMSRSHVSEEDEALGRVLACRIFPASDLELKVIGSMRRAVLGGESPKGFEK